MTYAERLSKRSDYIKVHDRDGICPWCFTYCRQDALFTVIAVDDDQRRRRCAVARCRRCNALSTIVMVSGKVIAVQAPLMPLEYRDDQTYDDVSPWQYDPS